MAPFQLQATDSEYRLSLSGDVTIDHARELHRALTSILVAPRPLRIDATDVTRLDAAIIQVLLSAARAASGAALLNPSSSCTDSLRRLALADHAPFAQPAACSLPP